MKSHYWANRIRRPVCGDGIQRTLVRAIHSVAVATLFCLAQAAAQPPPPDALPTGGRVGAGEAAIHQDGNQMSIDQATQRAVFFWETFNIGQDAAVRFNQPDSSSISLNRVLSLDPSRIYGSLSANGQVFLLNPGGVIFGKTARVDVGALGVSTLGMKESDFMAGRYFFEKALEAGPITNEGRIQAANGGYVAFIAPRIENRGEVIADRGSVAMMAGDRVSLNFSGNRLVNFTIEKGAVDALIENKQLIRAGEGAVILSAKAADSLAKAVVNNSGVIEAKGITEAGGRIILEGDDISLASSSKIDASGPKGGGEAFIGGEAHGTGSLRHAQSLFMEQGATIDVSATDRGKGGKAVLWSDGATRMDGTILARGGPNGGDGGFVETSGYTLNIDPGALVDTLAPVGAAGEWLLDPYDIVIASAGGNVSGATIAASLNTSNVTLDTALAQYQVGSTNTDYTTPPIPGNGDIRVSDDIFKTGGSTTTLTLKANRNITVNNAISSNSGPLNVVLWADADANAGGYVQLGHNAPITTSGGHLWIGGGSGSAVWNGLAVGDGFAQGTTAMPHGIYLSNGVISTSGGDIAMYGKSATTVTAGSAWPDSQPNAAGIYSSFNDQYHIDSGTGTIYMEALGAVTSAPWGFAVADALYLNGGSMTSAAGSGDAITLIGDATAVNYGSGTRGSGMSIIGWNAAKSNMITATGGGNVVLSGAGTSQNSSGYNYGIRLSSVGGGSNNIITSGGGNIVLTGVANDNTALSSIGFETANDKITSSGNLTLNGTGKPVNLSGPIVVDGLTTFNASGQNIAVNATGNHVAGALTVSAGRNISLVNADALTLGTVNATGTVDIATLAGDLTVSQDITTTDAGNAAVRLNAGKNTAAGAAAGGNIVISGSPAIVTGAGGRATLYTGSVSGSTGLTALPGSGNGRFRYNSDESATNYTVPLGSGAYAVYREQPALTVAADNAIATYGAAPALTATVSGLQNGDAPGQAISTPATIAIGGSKSSSNNHVAGSHTLTPSGAVGGLGYGLSYANGTLTVNQKAITGSVTASNKVYDGNSSAAILTRTWSGTIAGDDISYTGGAAAFFDKNAGSGKTVTATGLGLAGADADNYTANTTATTAADIAKRPLTIKADDKGKVYGEIDPVLTATFTGLVGGETPGVASGLTLAAPTGANATAGAHAITADNATAANYAITHQNGTLTVSKALLTVTAGDKDRIQGMPNPPLTATYVGFKYNDSTADIATKPAISTTAVQSSLPDKYPITLSGGVAANYDLAYTAGTLTVNPKPATDSGALLASNIKPDMNPAPTLAPSQTKLVTIGDEKIDSVVATGPGGVLTAADLTGTGSEGSIASHAAGPTGASPPGAAPEAGTATGISSPVPTVAAAAESKPLSPIPVEPAPAPPPLPVPQPAVPKSKGYVVLLENEDGTTGVITVSNARGSQVLDKKGFGVSLTSGDKPLEAPFKVSDEMIKADFERTLNALPARPVDFLLYFESGGSVLTRESRLKTNEILSALKERTVSGIGIIGHTDSSGDSKANYRLGLLRARSVRKILLNAGVEAEKMVDIVSHGENNPAVATANGAHEPRNRRVQVTVW